MFKRNKEIIQVIKIPIITDHVLNPELLYGNEITGIYFETEDENFGRITFQSIDSLKICRGENLPYKFDWGKADSETWVFEIKNSIWKNERYQYEKENYGSSYEFGGNVEDMKTDYSHYLFKFHDQFIEVIAKGFWFEKDPKSLKSQPLVESHPFLSLTDKKSEIFNYLGINYKVKHNDKSLQALIDDAKFTEQKIFQIEIELDNKYSNFIELTVSNKYNAPKYILRKFFGQILIETNDCLDFQKVKPFLEK